MDSLNQPAPTGQHARQGRDELLQGPPRTPLLAEALTKISPAGAGQGEGDRNRLRSDVPEFDVFADDRRHQGRRPVRRYPGTGVWRSMLTEQYSKSFAKAGGVGISNDVFRTLILQQANRAG